MPISHASEYPDEQDILLLRGPLFQILNLSGEKAGDHIMHVVQMVIVMLNANRDHATELAGHKRENQKRERKKERKRRQFGQMCAATKSEICVSLAKKVIGCRIPWSIVE